MFIKRLPSTRLIVVSLFIVALSIVLSSLLLLDGPRIRKVVYDSAKLPREANQTVVLRANQPIQEIDKSKLSISPKVDYSVTSSGEAIVVQFKQRLNFATTYTLSIDELTTNNGRTTTGFTTAITTDEAHYYYLTRGQESREELLQDVQRPDVIKRGVVGGKEEVVYSADKILDYNVLGEELVVLTSSDSDEHSLVIYNPKEKRERNVELPGKGTIEQLAVSSDDRLIGFLYTDSDTKQRENSRSKGQLFTYDNKADVLVPILDISGKAILTPTSWRFHPDGSSMVVQMEDSTVLMVDSYHQQAPLPVGTYYKLGNFSRDGTQLVVGDQAAEGVTILDFKNDSKLVLANSEVDAEGTFISDAILLQNQPGYMQISEVYSLQDNAYTRYFDIKSNDTSRRIYQVNNYEKQTLNYGISSNDQYVTLDFSNMADKPKSDNYGSYTKPENIQSLIIDANEPEKVFTLNGFKVIWQ